MELKRFISYLGIIFLLGVMHVKCLAQKFDWVEGYIGNDLLIGDMSFDSQNNVLISGHFEGIVDFDLGSGVTTLSSPSNDHGFFAKYTTDYNLMWVRQIKFSSVGRIPAIKEDIQGNIIIAGVFQDTADFDTDTGTFEVVANGLEDVFIAKYDSIGHLIWVRTFGGTNWEYVESMKLDDNDNIYVTGLVNGSVDLDAGPTNDFCSHAGSQDILLVKYDHNGNYKWGFAVGGTSSDRGYDIALDGSSNVYISGSMSTTVDFNPGSGTANVSALGGSDHFLAKYDSIGGFQWAFALGHSSGSAEQDAQLGVDAAGNVTIGQRFRGPTDFDPSLGSAILNSNGTYDMFLANYSSSGAFQWVHGFGGSTGPDYIYDVTVEDNGIIYVTGTYGDTTDFDPSADTAFFPTTGTGDMFFASYNPDGSYRFARPIHGNSSIERIEQVGLDGLGNVFINGYFNGTIDFDPGLGTSNLTASGTLNSYISKYSTCTDAVSSLPSSMLVCPGDTFSILAGGNLNDYAEWSWYAGTCGDTLLDTGDSLTINGAVSKTYYLRGEGNCLIPGTCDSIVVDASDNIDPVPNLSSLPDSVVECAVTVQPPSATDNCVGTIIGMTTDSVIYTTQGSRSITWTFDDGNGNTITQTQTVIVSDTTAPVPIETVLADSIDECNVTLQAPIAIDNCKDSVFATTTDSITYSTQGTRTITWTYNDGHGNTMNQVQNVVINDVTLPAVVCPSDVTDDLDGSGPTISVNNIDVTAHDDCGIKTITYLLIGATTGSGTGDASGTAFNEGTTLVTYLVEDNNGNIDSCSFEVEINNPFVGVEQITTSDAVEVYPNPSDGILKVEMKEAFEFYNVLVKDLRGRDVFRMADVSEKNTTIDLGHLEAGVYLFILRTKEAQYLKRISIY